MLFILLVYFADEIVNIILKIGGTPYNWILNSALPPLKFANFNALFVSKNHYLLILYILSSLKALKMKMYFLIKILAISTFGLFVKDFYNFLTLKSIKI